MAYAATRVKSTSNPRSASIRVHRSGCRVQGSPFRVQSPGFTVEGSLFRVHGLGVFRVQGSWLSLAGLRVEIYGPRAPV
eukprot:3940508-Rhodomonas_salina.4